MTGLLIIGSISNGKRKVCRSATLLSSYDLGLGRRPFKGNRRFMQKTWIIGADECGYGCWAGPICVAAVRAPENWHIPGLNDSKKLSAKKRESLSERLWELHRSGDIFISVMQGTNHDIDKKGVAVIQKKLFVEVINDCKADDTTAIVDGTLSLSSLLVPYQSMVKADAKISAVMAASIVAKVYRDQWMYRQHELYPEYDFINNVGYRSEKHEAALIKLGSTPLHRMSYKVKAYEQYNARKER